MATAYTERRVLKAWRCTSAASSALRTCSLCRLSCAHSTSDVLLASWIMLVLSVATTRGGSPRRGVWRPSQNRLEKKDMNLQIYRITTPVRKMHLDRVATHAAHHLVSSQADFVWALESQTECRSRVGTRACVSAHRPTPPHRSGTADASFDSRLGAKRRPGWLTPAKSPLREHAGIA